MDAGSASSSRTPMTIDVDESSREQTPVDTGEGEDGDDPAPEGEDATEDAEDEPTEEEEEDDACWLCTYQPDQEAKRLMDFIVRSVGVISITNIAKQVSAFIYTRYEDVADADGNRLTLVGARPKHIERHITSHVLHPKVRFVPVIQDLEEFERFLRKNLIVEDAATGLSVVDRGNVDLYFKVIALRKDLYKIEPSTMLFGREETHAATAPT